MRPVRRARTIGRGGLPMRRSWLVFACAVAVVSAVTVGAALSSARVGAVAEGGSCPNERVNDGVCSLDGVAPRRPGGRPGRGFFGLPTRVARARSQGHEFRHREGLPRHACAQPEGHRSRTGCALCSSTAATRSGGSLLPAVSAFSATEGSVMHTRSRGGRDGALGSRKRLPLHRADHDRRNGQRLPRRAHPRPNCDRGLPGWRSLVHHSRRTVDRAYLRSPAPSGSPVM